MKFLLDGALQTVGSAFGAVCGVHCDEIVFNKEDIARMVQAGPERLHTWLAERVQCRFAPGNVPHHQQHAEQLARHLSESKQLLRMAEGELPSADLMTPKVVDLDEQRPHYMVVGLDGNANVLPVQLVDNWVKGTVPLDEPVVRAILDHWQGLMKPKRGWV